MTKRESLWAWYTDWYRDFSTDPGREYFANMLVFIERLHALPEFDQLIPHTSLFWLIVNKHEGYQPELPFISVQCNEDGSFTLQLFKEVAVPSGPEITRPLDQAIEAFSQMAATF
jgi:hypothetical protein